MWRWATCWGEAPVDLCTELSARTSMLLSRCCALLNPPCLSMPTCQTSTRHPLSIIQWMTCAIYIELSMVVGRVGEEHGFRWGRHYCQLVVSSLLGLLYAWWANNTSPVMKRALDRYIDQTQSKLRSVCFDGFIVCMGQSICGYTPYIAFWRKSVGKHTALQLLMTLLRHCNISAASIHLSSAAFSLQAT